jgi:L-cysteine S-thiosulfotransferase
MIILSNRHEVISIYSSSNSPMKMLLPFTFIILTACSTTIPTPQLITENNGKKIAFAREKGNCLACHEIEDGEFTGNIGPALKNLPTRFKNKRELKAQIWDATQLNPETSMPPFGRNKILSEDEIDQVVDYLWALK